MDTQEEKSEKVGPNGHLSERGHFFLEIMDNQTAVTILLPLVVALLFWILTKRRAPKNLPPGPPSIPILGSLPFSGLLGNKDINVGLARLAESYGDVFHLWIGKRLAVALNSYDVIHEALLNNAVALTGRPEVSLPGYNVRQLGIVESTYSAKWKHNRNLSLSILKEFDFGKSLMEKRITDQVHIMLSQLDELQGDEFDPHRVVQVSVANIIFSIVLGQHFHRQDKQFLHLVDSIEAVFDSFMEVAHLEYLPIRRMLPWVKRQVNTFVQNHDEILGILMEFIEEHKRCHVKGDNSDFVHAYLDREDTADTEEDRDESLLYTLRDLFSAGTETTTTFLRWAFVYMANYPDVQTKVQEELDSVVLLSGRPPSLNDKAKLPYTEAVIQELHRLAAVAPTALPHQTLDDVSIRGYAIPKGTMVLCNLWAVLRDPVVWPEPDMLKPERFLTEDGKVIQRPDIIPFSLGRRSCIGEVMARQEIFLFFTNILHNYCIRRPEGADKIDETGRVQLARVPGKYKIITTKRQ